jgi:hypothetical protein
MLRADAYDTRLCGRAVVVGARGLPYLHLGSDLIPVSVRVASGQETAIVMQCTQSWM